MTENEKRFPTMSGRLTRTRTMPTVTGIRHTAVRPVPAALGILLAAGLLSSCGGGGDDAAPPETREPAAESGETDEPQAADPSAAPGSPDSNDTDPPETSGTEPEAVDAGGGEAPEATAMPDGIDDDSNVGSGAELDAGTFSDEFDRDTLSEWMLRHEVEGADAQYSTLDIDGTTGGALTLVPTLTPGWFADGDAPLVFKSVTGDFSVETEVLAESVASPGLAPNANFNSAGLMARDPAGATDSENYVMVNVGRQNDSIAGSVGSETKSTRDSASRLDLQAGSNRGRLVLCRVGERFSTYRLLDNETDWTRIGDVIRNDLPATLQVGLVANGFSGPDLRATFEYITLRVPSDVTGCTPDP